VAGHSLGGAVALALADRRPQAVGGLVLLSSCVKLPETDAWTEHVFSYLPGPLRKIMFFTTARRILFAPGASDRAVEVGMQELVACRAETIRKDLEAAKVMDLVAQARRVDVPTLIMCGSRDQVTPPRLSERLHELIRRSRLSIIEGTGHMVILEAPERVNRDILDFIGALGVPGQAPSRRAPAPTPSVFRRLLDLARPLFHRSRAEQ
jgi:pimeloyl-ACP methyl ester carboxylesterase